LRPLPRKILIIKPSSLGDIIHSLPFLQVMRDVFPAAEIHWVVARGLEAVLEQHPMVDRVIIINKDSWKRPGNIRQTVTEFSDLAHRLRKEAYDLVVDLQGLLRSSIIAATTGAPVRVGFREAREGSVLFYTHRVEGGKELHAVDRCLRIASALGGDMHEVKFPMPLVKASQAVKELKERFGEYAIIVPGARWPTKQWPAERFGTLAAMLDMPSILVGSAADMQASQNIAEGSRGKAVSCAGQTEMKDLFSLLRDARVVISNDSGPMHIAAAYGRPVVAIFGPTNPVRTGPYGTSNVVTRTALRCAPCYKKKCGELKCMKDIAVEQVYDAVKQVTSAP
ncbi:MAG TPA: lipopolysaccharide heptosyltransferase I, partial [Dissulfurispiraceae bacterium]|nr:lipopolysaccharide heptosyltransferase I [Dissulfurispiraceae bacterium]